MGIQQLTHIKQKKLSNRINYYVLPMIIVCAILNGCMFYNGTYYEYLTEAPIITTDWQLAMQKQIVAQKRVNDTIYYYCTEVPFRQTKDYETAKKNYITIIKNLKNGKPIGKQVYLDGLGDTLNIACFDENHLLSLTIYYYGNKIMESYQEYKKDKKHGISQLFYPNGNLRYVTNWKDDYLYSEEISYYQNGQIKNKGNNKDGVKSGLWVYFNEKGDTIQTENYINGVLKE